MTSREVLDSACNEGHPITQKKFQSSVDKLRYMNDIVHSHNKKTVGLITQLSVG